MRTRIILSTALFLIIMSPQTQAAPNIMELSCLEIINGGWSHMPNMADYVLTKPHSDKLGYGSECHIDSLVFAQCFAEPKWSVKEAVNNLIRKAIAGKPLPDVPACGA